MGNVIIKKSDAGSPLLVHKERDSTVLMSIVNKSASNSSKVSTDPKSTHKVAEPSNEEEEGKTNWIPWGNSDDFPREIAKLMRKTTVGRAGLQRLTKYLYGQRIITYKIEDIDDSGREVIKMVRLPEWEQISQRSNMKAIRLINFQDYSYYAIAFVEIIFSKDKSKVVSLHAHKASHCRFAEAKNGRIPHVFVSGNFPSVNPKECQKIPVIDMLEYPGQIEEIRKDKKVLKYVMPLYWPDVLNDYYPVVFWDSARESGWLDIATSIPAYKKALFKNQMSLKYHIKVPQDYFKVRYSNWETMPQDDKDKIIEELYLEVNDMLTGAENAQKAIMTFTATDKHTQKEIGAWSIEVIDDKMKQASYLPDSAAANSEILFAMGMNPAISGQGNTGGSYTGGANNGGSNIRESGLDLRSQLRADRDILLTPFDFVKLYNGLDPEVEIGVQDMVLTTIDQGKGTEKVVS